MDRNKARNLYEWSFCKWKSLQQTSSDFPKKKPKKLQRLKFIDGDNIAEFHLSNCAYIRKHCMWKLFFLLSQFEVGPKGTRRGSKGRRKKRQVAKMKKNETSGRGSASAGAPFTGTDWRRKELRIRNRRHRGGRKKARSAGFSSVRRIDVVHGNFFSTWTCNFVYRKEKQPGKKTPKSWIWRHERRYHNLRAVSIFNLERQFRPENYSVMKNLKTGFWMAIFVVCIARAASENGQARARWPSCLQRWHRLATVNN